MSTRFRGLTDKSGGGRGIRTHETFLFTGFQDQLHRPLGQTSVDEFTANAHLANA
jgi:hypothetical protein